MKKKHLPRFLRFKLVDRLIHSLPGVLASYWVFQGMLYMDGHEVLFKLSLDAVLALLLFTVGMPVTVAVLIAHTLNMLFNGHVWALLRHQGIGSTPPEKFISYIAGMQKRLQKLVSLSGAAAYGSLSRGLYQKTSDIDLRIFPAGNQGVWLKIACFCLAERTRALFAFFPLDLYAFDLELIDKKMRADEPPIVFSDQGGLLKEKYAQRESFEDFLRSFTKRNSL